MCSQLEGSWVSSGGEELETCSDISQTFLKEKQPNGFQRDLDAVGHLYHKFGNPLHLVNVLEAKSPGAAAV